MPAATSKVDKYISLKMACSTRWLYISRLGLLVYKQNNHRQIRESRECLEP